MHSTCSIPAEAICPTFVSWRWPTWNSFELKSEEEKTTSWECISSTRVSFFQFDQTRAFWLKMMALCLLLFNSEIAFFYLTTRKCSFSRHPWDDRGEWNRLHFHPENWNLMWDSRPSRLNACGEREVGGAEGGGEWKEGNLNSTFLAPPRCII